MRENPIHSVGLVCLDNDRVERLRSLAESKFSYCMRIVGVASDEFKGIKMINAESPEVVIVCSLLKNTSAQEFRECLSDRPIKWVFVTDELDEPHISNATYFLGREISEQSVSKLLHLIGRDLGYPCGFRPATIRLKYKESQVRLKTEDIAYLKAEGNYTHFMMDGQQNYFISKNINYYEKKLGSNFYRIHHSYLINLDKVIRLSADGSAILTAMGEELPLAKRRKKSFLKYYSNHLKYA